MTERRKVRTLVRDGQEFREFEFFEDATEFLKVADLGESTAAVLDETADPTATVLLLENDGPPPVALVKQFAAYPREHRGAFLLSGLAMMNTYSSRDPVLVVNAVEMFVIVVTSAERLGAFIAKRYSGTRLNVATPPTHPQERWVVSLTAEGMLCGAKVGMGPRTDIARA